MEWHLPVPTLQAGRGRQSCVEPCCHSIIDGVTSAAAAIRAPVTSSVGLPTETGPGWGREVVLGCRKGPGAGVLILELESCHCALTTLGTGNIGQQEHREPGALGTGRTGSQNQWTLGTLWALGP